MLPVRKLMHREEKLVAVTQQSVAVLGPELRFLLPSVLVLCSTAACGSLVLHLENLKWVWPGSPKNPQSYHSCPSRSETPSADPAQVHIAGISVGDGYGWLKPMSKLVLSMQARVTLTFLSRPF